MENDIWNENQQHASGRDRTNVHGQWEYSQAKIQKMHMHGIEHMNIRSNDNSKWNKTKGMAKDRTSVPKVKRSAQPKLIWKSEKHNQT